MKIAVSFLFLTLAGCSSSTSTGGKDGQIPADKTADWTIRDMMNHLESKKYQFKWQGTGNNEALITGTALMKSKDGPPSDAYARSMSSSGYSGFVKCSKKESDQAAKEFAGSTQNGISFGRFTFIGDADEIKLISKCLK